MQIDKIEFERRSQMEGESFDDYMVAIRKLARNAELCEECLDDRLLTKIMSGVNDQEVREELLAKIPTPKLEEAILFARNKETAKSSNMDLTGKTVQQIKGRDRLRSRSESPRGNFRRDPPRSRSRQERPFTKQRCYFCNSEDCFSKNEGCRAFGKKCNECGLKDHFPSSVACQKGWSMRKTRPHQGQFRGGRAVQVRGLHCTKRAPRTWFNLKTEDGTKRIGSFQAYPDSAADCTIMGQHVMRKLGMRHQDLEPPDNEGINAANKSPFTMIGKAKVTIEYCGRSVRDVIHVVKEETDLLVSWDSCIALNILPKNYPNPIDGPLDMETRRTRSISTTGQKESDKFIESLISKIGNMHEPSQTDLKMIKGMIMKEYAEVFSVEEQLQAMECKPMKIELKPGAIPTRISTPRKIGPSIKPKVKSEVEDMVKKDIIEFVPADHATEWCHPFCPREKGSGGIRPTVDFRGLNEWVKRPVYPVTTPHEAVYNTTPGSRFFSVMDAKNGYHQIMLHEDSRDLTCFMTPWGRYRFKRAPQGFSATGDKYNYEGDIAISGIDDVNKVVDDILTSNPEIKEHIMRIIQVLERCRKHKITLSPNKFVFAQPEVKYVGYIIGREGIKVDPEKVKAIREFPRPTNISELRSFDGMVNQIGNFSTEIAEAQGVLRELRQKKNMFTWGKEHDEAFEAVKQCLTRLPILALFDPGLRTRIEADGSKLKGLGYSLQQFHGDGCKCKCAHRVWRNVQCGSRWLSEAESRYAPVEFEALAVAWGVHKCKYFLAGLPEFIIRNDHRTLIPLLNSKSLNEIDNPRVSRLIEKLRPYRYKAEHVSGIKNCVADALSRAPVDQPTEEDLLGEEESPRIRQIIRRAASCAGIEDELQETLVDPNIEWIKGAASQDRAYQELLEAVKGGFPKRMCDARESIRPYFALRNELSEHHGLVILRSCRIIIPVKLRKEILRRLHASHQGIERTKRRARETVYWPSVDSDIVNTVASCSPCSERLPSQQKEPMKTDPYPERAFEQTATDLFDFGGRTYIVYTDRYSGWPCIHMWQSAPTSRKVIDQMKRWFVDWGIPLMVRSDGGPQYNSREYREFMKEWGVNPPGLSTPTYAQSNGRAEAAVKAMKALVQKASVNGDITCDEFQRGLLEWRNTPKEHGKSPAELVFGCQQRSFVPSLKNNLIPPWKVAIESKVAELQRRSESYYNIGAKTLKELNIGDRVRVQHSISKKWAEIGTIIEKGNKRDYIVKIDGGRTRWRNRRFLRPAVEFDPELKREEDDGTRARDNPSPKSILRRSTREKKATVRFNI